jgi:hypothetical protein
MKRHLNRRFNVAEKLFNDKEVEGDQKTKEEELPEEFKGKSPKELADEILKSREQVKGVTERLDTISETVKGLKATREEPKKTVQDEKPDFFTEPEKAAAALFEEKMRPLQDRYMSDAAVAQMNKLHSMPYYEPLKEEIGALIAATPEEARSQPGFAEAIHAMAAGQHIDKVKKYDVEKAKKTAEFTETKTSGGVRDQSKEPELDALEAEVAEGQGLTPENYALWRDNPAKARKLAAEERAKGANRG